MKNSTDPVLIDHSGIVQKIDNNSVTVLISASSACAGCQAEGSCNMSGKEDKIIDVAGKYDYKPGDDVTVLMKQSMGYKALFLAYLLPLILVISLLLILLLFNVSEAIAGVTSIAVLIPFYIILFLIRNKISEKFTFTLKA